MNLAFEYSVNGMDNIDSESPEWMEAKKLFVDEKGISQMKSIFGLVLRPSQDLFDEEFDGSMSASIENLYIHDLIISPIETVKLGVGPDSWLRNSFNAPIDLSQAIKMSFYDHDVVDTEDSFSWPGVYPDAFYESDIADAVYYGDVYSDAIVAMAQLSSSWWSLARTLVWPEVIEWTQSGESLASHLDGDHDLNEIKQICGYDEVSGVSKGVVGLKIAYSEDIEISGLRIENLVNMGQFGHSTCDYDGKYYEGNQARAISIYQATGIIIDDLTVSNIVSFSGAAYGIYVDDEDITEMNINEMHQSMHDLLGGAKPGPKNGKKAPTTNKRALQKLEGRRMNRMKRRFRRQLLGDDDIDDVDDDAEIENNDNADIDASDVTDPLNSKEDTASETHPIPLETNAKKKEKAIERTAPVITLNDATFTHIDAGVLGTYSGVDISKDVDFNMAASSCAIYCEDTCDGIEFGDISQQCMNGHMYCNEMKQMITEIECNLDADYDTPIGTIYVRYNGMVDADLFRPPRPDIYTPFIFKGQWFACGIVLLLGLFFLLKCLYFNKRERLKRKQRKQDLDLAAAAADGEYGSLLTDNDLIDYDTLDY